MFEKLQTGEKIHDAPYSSFGPQWSIEEPQTSPDNLHNEEYYSEI